MSVETELPSTEVIDLSNLPVLPLRDVVVYPHMVIPLFVGRQKSIRALEGAMIENKRVVLVAQRKSSDDDPGPDDLFNMGTISSLLQLLKLPDGTVKVLVEGEQRVKIDSFSLPEEGGYIAASTELVDEINAAFKEQEIQIMMRSLMSQFEQYIKLNKKIPPEVLASLAGIEDAGRLTDTITAHLSLKVEDKQELLEVLDVGVRLERLMAAIENE